MARNSSGVYSLPVSAYVSGTVIKSADMNSNLSDIANTLTLSVATTGVSSMTGPLKASDGTVTAPGYTFASDTTAGFYHISTGVFAGTVNSTQFVQFNADLSVAWAGAQSFASSVSIGTTLVVTGASTLTGGATFSAGSTVTYNATTYVFGASAAAALVTAMGLFSTLQFTIDGGGSVPSTGVRGYLEVPHNCTITRWTIMADQVGSAVVDVTKSTYAGFPPTVSIAGTAKPTLTAAQKNQTSTLTGWTTTWTSGDILGFNLQSVATCTRIQVSLLIKRTGL